MKKKEDKIYGHIEPVEISEEIINLPQYQKWYRKELEVHPSRQGEYQAQSMAWALQEVPWSEMDNSFKNALSYSTGDTLEDLRKKNEFFHPTWGNVLARA